MEGWREGEGENRVGVGTVREQKGGGNGENRRLKDSTETRGQQLG